MARSQWEVVVGGNVRKTTSRREAAMNAGWKESRSIAVRRGLRDVRVRNPKSGEAYRLVRGSWIRVDARGAAGGPVKAA